MRACDMAMGGAALMGVGFPPRKLPFFSNRIYGAKGRRAGVSPAGIDQRYLPTITSPGAFDRVPGLHAVKRYVFVY